MNQVTDIAILPQDDSTNGWSRVLASRTPHVPLRGDIRADWVVVGAGWAGLAAARRLGEARPNDRIVLLEAGQAGEGASGRNSGFAIDLPHNVGSSLDELNQSHRYMALARAAIAHLQEQVDHHGIACDWSLRGKYHAAHSVRGTEEVLQAFAKELEALGEPFRWLDAKQIQAEIGTPYFHAAIHTPGGALLNPAALCRGLADSLPANVTLHEGTPVTRLEQSNGLRLTTPGGSVFAPQMILATNGFAEQFGFYRRRMMTFAAHASLTRRLTREERRALGGEDDWGLTPANAFAGVTMRFTRDHRILVRQKFRYSPELRSDQAERDDARLDHMDRFRRRFPMLPDVTMEHTWTGFICLSKNNAPGFGRVAPGIHAAVCQNAVGVTKGTIGGLLAADMAMGVDNPLIADMQSLGEPDLLPPCLLLRLGVPARMAWDIWRARHEK